MGPHAVIGERVEIGEGTEIGPHAVIRGPSRIGRDNRFYPFCSIGDDPQDMKYRRGERSLLQIGDRNTIREYCSINRGTEQGGGTTVLGNDNWIMACVHVAHDCMIGNHAILANNVMLAGHVCVEDHALLGGSVGVHQFCRIGAYSFLAGFCALRMDTSPYLKVVMRGGKAHPVGLNIESLRRNRFPAPQIKALNKAYRIFYRSGLRQKEALRQLGQLAQQHPPVQHMLDFIRKSVRGILR